MSAPIACTLPGPELRDRLGAIAALAKRALLAYEQDGATLSLRYANEAADELEAVVAQERECCAFLDFDLVRRSDAVHLVITAPAETIEFAPVLMAHFLGQPARQLGGCGASCGCNAGSAA